MLELPLGVALNQRAFGFVVKFRKHIAGGPSFKY